MADVLSPQGRVLVSYEAETPYNATQMRVSVLYNLPAIQLRSSQSFSKVLYGANLNVNASQARAFVLYSGRIDTPKLKAWGFNLDGHRFYVIRLGSRRKTLVYDLATGTISWWARKDIPSLDINSGINWRSAGSLSANYGSNILVGDASNGNLYIMDPNSPFDSSEFQGDITFSRVATGQIPIRGRSHDPVFSAYLTADLGEPAYEGASITLSYSDDQGRTYVAPPSVEVKEGDYGQEIFWRSLGSMRPPGRLFRIEDDGAVARVDSLDVNIE